MKLGFIANNELIGPEFTHQVQAALLRHLRRFWTTPAVLVSETDAYSHSQSDST